MSFADFFPCQKLCFSAFFGFDVSVKVVTLGFGCARPVLAVYPLCFEMPALRRPLGEVRVAAGRVVCAQRESSVEPSARELRRDTLA